MERNFAVRSDNFEKHLPGLTAEQICKHLHENDEGIYAKDKYKDFYTRFRRILWEKLSEATRCSVEISPYYVSIIDFFLKWIFINKSFLRNFCDKIRTIAADNNNIAPIHIVFNVIQLEKGETILANDFKHDPEKRVEEQMLMISGLTNFIDGTVQAGQMAQAELDQYNEEKLND